MSIIGTIRNRFTWLLLLLVGLAILAFLVMDGVNGRGNTLGANQTIGGVAGKKVKAMDIQKRMIELKSLYPNAQDDQLRNMAWTDIVNEQVMDPRMKDLGIGVTKAELTELIKGDNPHQYARQMFSGLFPDGNYDANVVNEFLKENENGEQIIQQLTTAIRDAKKNEKYSYLLRNGVNVPKWMAEDEFVKQYKTVDFDYVFLPYTLVGDNEVVINDTDIRNYAQAHKAKYEGKNGYTLQYVPFDQTASKEDSTKQLIEFQDLATRFKASKNPAQFANTNTTVQLDRRQMAIDPNIEYQTTNTMRMDDAQKAKVLNASVGDVVGPFTFNGYAYLTRILSKETIADSAKVRHILIENQSDYTQAKALADSLATVLKSDKSKFNDFVSKYSKDEASIPNNGVYDFFPQGQMVPEFNTAAFNNDIGSIEVVETMFGFHIIEPMARKGSNNAVKVATVVKSFSPSKATLDAAYNNAKKFEKESQTEEAFLENAKQYGGVKTTPVIELNATSIQGIGQNYNLTSWANKANVGAVKYFTNSGGNSLVVRLASKSKKGEIDLAANRVEIENEVRKEKQAEILSKKIAENGGANQDLQTLASKLGRQVQKATEAKFGASGEGIGYEPEVISKLFFQQKGKVDEVIKGRRGVYVVSVTDFGTLPPESNFDQYKTTFSNAMNSKANTSAILTQLEEKGIIKDERYKLR